jgi:hypothetical protein
MRKSTIKLTKHELDFASDTIYPETKQSILRKVQELFLECEQKISQHEAYQELAGRVFCKITKGEQYRGLPYMVLDCPQIKGPEIDIVVRTLFWWGHYFSCNLIIRTDKLSEEQDVTAIRDLRKTRLLTGTDLWEQDLDSPAYKKCTALRNEEIQNMLHTSTYLKLSRKIPLHKYQTLPEQVDGILSQWIVALSIKKGAD